LRKAYDALKAENATLKKQFEEAKKATPADDPEKKRLGETNAQYLKRIESLEKQAQTLEEHVKFADFTKSTEYKEKYYQPFVDSYNEGRAATANLKIIERKNGEDEIIQPARQATAEDFDAIMSIRDDGEAADKAYAQGGGRSPQDGCRARDQARRADAGCRGREEEILGRVSRLRTGEIPDVFQARRDRPRGQQAFGCWQALG
jgi:hypothetical protein